MPVFEKCHLDLVISFLGRSVRFHKKTKMVSKIY